MSLAPRLNQRAGRERQERGRGRRREKRTACAGRTRALMPVLTCVCAHVHACTRPCSPRAQASPGCYTVMENTAASAARVRTQPHSRPPRQQSRSPPSQARGWQGGACPALSSLPLNRPGITVLLHYPPPNPNLDHQPPLMGHAGAFNSFQEHLGWKQTEGLESRRGPIG